MSTPALIEPFLAYLGEQDRAAGTIANMRYNLSGFFAWFEANCDQACLAVNVTPLDIRQYREWLKEQKFKPSTINHRLSDLRAFLRWSVSMGHIAANPAERIKPVKVAKHAPRWLTRPQCHAMLRLAEQRVMLAAKNGLTFTGAVAMRNLAIVTLLLNTGLRVSELCDLKTDDIELRPRSGMLTVRSGKGGKYREIPLNHDARHAVTRWLQVRPAGEGSYLFTTPGGRMTRQLVEHHLSELGQVLGFKLSPHLLRHTFAKNLVDSGISIDRVAMLLGHSDLSTTAVYTTPGLADLQQAVDKISWGD